MHRLRGFTATLAALVALDLAVAAVLAMVDARVPALAPLVRFFEYGRSVPGKLERWLERPDEPGNLVKVGWRPDTVRDSADRFLIETATGPTIRGYGMSFSNDILSAARSANPGLVIDLHAGPGAPPNYAFALFLEDRANRRPGDIVVMGVLASSMVAVAAMSNRTWVFEQPAPFTYPAFRAEGAALVRIDPIVQSLDDERRAQTDPVFGALWAAQIAAEDVLYDPTAFAVPALDASPFLRLVRRTVAVSAITRRKAAMMKDGGSAEYVEALRLILRDFGRIAREDGQVPMVLLIQTRDPADPDARALLAAALEENGITYLATADEWNPRDPSGFVGDGHYTEAVNRRFGEAFLKLLQESRGSVPEAVGADGGWSERRDIVRNQR